MSFMKTVWLHFRAKLKNFALLLILIYFTYVSNRFDKTKHFADTSELCLSAKSKCTKPSETMSVQEIDSFTSTFMICVDTKDMLNIKPCFSDKELNTFVSNVDLSPYSNMDLSEYVSFQDDNMYYCKFIIGLVIICLFLSLMFDTPSEYVIRRTVGAFLTQEGLMYMRRLIYLNLFLISIILIRMIVNYSLVYPMKCQEPDPKDPYSKYCIFLSENSVEIKSLIFPQDMFIRPFKSISIFLAVLVIFGTLIYRPVQEVLIVDHNLVRRSTRLGVRSNRVYMRGELDSSSEGEEELERIRDAQSEGIRRANFSLSDSIFVQSERQRIFSKMKMHADMSSCREFSECAICLNDLFLTEDAAAAVKCGGSCASNNPRVVKWEGNDPNDSNPNLNLDLEESQITENKDGVKSSFGDSSSSEPSVANIVLETNCGHIFHKSCLLKWYIQQQKLPQQTCPVCRAQIK